MRVALRRLRSAISLFRRATACPALDETNALLKQLGKLLAPPRDWDVFTLGVGAKVGAAFAEDVAVQDLLYAAERKRQAGYANLTQFLTSHIWRQLGIALAALAVERPWEISALEIRQRSITQGSDNDIAEQQVVWQDASLPSFAARMLSRRYRALLAPGADLSALPISELHNVRLAGKRLRYAAEFFAPLFPGRTTRRFLRRMAVLQERLGDINDTGVAAELMAQLAGRSSARAGAIGVVRGFVAASGNAGRARIERSWKRLLRQDCFWP
jgi:CHAD domain-containing protein